MTRTTNRWMLLAGLFALCATPRAWAERAGAAQDTVQQLELGPAQAGWQQGRGQSQVGLPQGVGQSQVGQSQVGQSQVGQSQAGQSQVGQSQAALSSQRAVESDLLPVAARRPSGIQAALADFAEAHRLSVQLAVDKRCDRRLGHRVGRLVVGGALNNIFETAAYGLVAAIGSSALTVNPLAIPLGILASQAMIKYPSVGTQLATYIGWRRDGSERGGIGGLFRGYVGLTRGVHLLSVAGCNVVANVFRRVQGKETKSLTEVVGGWRAQTKDLRPAAQPR